MSKKALGKGLNAIISNAPPLEKDKEIINFQDTNRIVEIDINLINPNPDQPRMNFNDEKIIELSESIKSVGLIQPIIVRKDGESYTIIAGERRFRASRAAGNKSIKCIVIQPKEEEDLTIALIENIQREDLDPIEEARAYRELINKSNLKQQDIANRVGKDRATIANSLRLLNLDAKIQKSLSEGKISVGHAKVLLSVPENIQLRLHDSIIKDELSVRELERRIESWKASGQKKTNKATSKDPHIREMEEKLISILGTKVEIKHSGNGGRIEISYYSLDDFDRIFDMII